MAWFETAGASAGIRDNWVKKVSSAHNSISGHLDAQERHAHRGGRAFHKKRKRAGLRMRIIKGLYVQDCRGANGVAKSERGGGLTGVLVLVMFVSVEGRVSF